MKQSHLLIFGGIFACAVLSLAGCVESATTSKPVQKRIAGTAPVKERAFQKRPGASLADQCYNDICNGSSTPELASLLKDKKNPGPGMQEYFKTTLLPLLTEKSRNTQKLAQARLTRLQEAEKNFASITLNPTQDKTVKTVMLLLRPSLLNQDVVKEANAALLATDFQKAKELYSVKKGSSYLQTLYKDQSVEAAALAEVTSLLATQEKLNKLAGASLFNFDNESIKKSSQHQPLSTEDIESISQDGHAIRLFDFFISGAGSAILEKTELDSEDLLALYQKSSFKTTLQNRMTSQDALIKSCETSYYQSLNLYPQAADLSNFKAKVELVRTEVANLVGAQDPAYDRIIAASFDYPKTPAEVTKEWVNTLKSDMAFEPNEIARTASYDDATMFLLAVIFSSTPNDINYLCGKMIDLDVSDKTLTTNAAVKVSWVSVRYPRVGLAIVAHELGHIVDQHSTSFGNQQICVKNKQPSSIHAGEDFADWFSSKTMIQLGKNEHFESENFGCFLAASNETLSLKNADNKDPHSSGLYRALQINIQLGKKTPASCQTLARQENSKATESCQ